MKSGSSLPHCPIQPLCEHKDEKLGSGTYDWPFQIPRTRCYESAMPLKSIRKAPETTAEDWP